jgi:UDP-N-acetylmuramate dehydrogenase
MEIQHDVPLAARTTLGLGGPAKRLARVTSLDELRQALADASRAGDPVLVLGGGSNLVIGDAGFAGLVIAIDLRGIAIEERDDHALVTAAAGVPWDAFVAELVDRGLAGCECLAGIPGLVGATPMQNVGAYGQEVSDTITRVRVLERATGAVVDFSPAQCRFGYRTSVFKGSDRWVVIEVEFRLVRRATSMPIKYAELASSLGISEGGTAPLAAVRERVIELRRRKGMVVDPGDPDSRSAGSFFMNPIVDAETLDQLIARLPPGTAVPRFAAPDGKTKLSAGWLIERAGFSRGTQRGNVGTSSKHALALVNRGGATTTELLALAAEIQQAVRTTLGIQLVIEPVIA